MSEVKRYDLGACYAHMYGLDVVECAEGDFVLASDYDKDTKALEDKARNQHARDSAELRDLCSQRDGFKAELWRVKEERDKLAVELVREKKRRRAIDDEAFNYSEQVGELKAELAELKAKMSGVDERVAFEAAYLKANYPRVAAGELSAPPIFGRVGSMKFHGQAEGDYECSDVQTCWVIWQARAAIPMVIPNGYALVPAQPAAPEVKHDPTL